GKLVIAGIVHNGSQKHYDFALIRLMANGAIDTSFGTNGHVIIDFGGTDEFLAGIVIQPDGKIVAAGSAGIICDLNSYDFVVARFNSDGTLDMTFGPNGDGRSRSDFGKFEIAYGVALQSDEKIVLAGLR